MAPKKSVVNCQASEYHRNDCLEIMCALSSTNAAELKWNDVKSLLPILTVSTSEKYKNFHASPRLPRGDVKLVSEGPLFKKSMWTWS